MYDFRECDLMSEPGCSQTMSFRIMGFLWIAKAKSTFRRVGTRQMLGGSWSLSRRALVLGMAGIKAAQTEDKPEAKETLSGWNPRMND